VFFAYIGFDAVCNTAEECVAPETTLPFGIVVSLMICACLYAGVTLVLTGLLAFDQLPADASLSAAFAGKNMDWILIVIDVGAVIGLTTTLFLGNWGQHPVERQRGRKCFLTCCLLFCLLCFVVDGGGGGGGGAPSERIVF